MSFHNEMLIVLTGESFVLSSFCWKQFYQELLFIQQTEMAAPSQGSYLTPAGHLMPAYSGRGRPPLNPQHSTVVSINYLITSFN